MSEFVSDSNISLTQLSTGCKTVLLAYKYKPQGRCVYLDITECGPEALAECLKIIDSNNIVGVLGAPLDVSCDYEAYELDIDDEHCTNWLYAVAAGTKRGKYSNSMSKIQFEWPYLVEDPDIKFEIDYTPPICILTGESGTGKTYLLNTLDMIVGSYIDDAREDPRINYGKIVVLNRFTDIQEFERVSRLEDYITFTDGYDGVQSMNGRSLMHTFKNFKGGLIVCARAAVEVPHLAEQILFPVFEGGTLKFVPKCKECYI